ncbi:hypothetical protein A2783_04155 [Microgenomates group bacterium RIFCSPHIGHO2_01_FULL_45_11]|nr:MAG: hypothetical protein A2783_04155 [Microgenomates group bacterium RIFCSPHIGHO2_01_FULL_45_11]
MTAPPRPLAVNLLPKDAFSESLVGKTLLWALSIGRYIVVFTEAIVILSFLSRFKLDRDLTDLNTGIEQQLAIIQSFGDLEQNIRNLQEKLDFIAALETQLPPQAVVNHLAQAIPPDVQLTEFEFTPEAVTFKAHALTTQGFSIFIRRVQTNPLFQDIELQDILSGSSALPGIQFQVTAFLSDKNNQEAPTTSL